MIIIGKTKTTGGEGEGEVPWKVVGGASTKLIQMFKENNYLNIKGADLVVC